MALPASLPADLREALASFPSEARSKVLEIHEKSNITEDQFECYMLNNHGIFTSEHVTTLQSFLDGEKAKKTEKATKAQQASLGTVARPGRKRPAVSLSAGLTAALGNAAPATLSQATSRAIVQASDYVSPYAAKRSHIAADLAPLLEAVAPDVEPRRPAPAVFTKTAVNGSVAKPVVDGARAGVNVELLGDADNWKGRYRAAYAFLDEPIEERAAAQDRRLAAMEEPIFAALRAKHGDDIDAGVIGVPCQAEVALCGRIACESLEGRLNERALLLEGRQGSSMLLNTAACSQVQAFPGQIVGVVGRSGGMAGSTFNAREFLAGLPSGSAKDAAASSASKDAVASSALVAAAPSGPLSALVAAGPFCLRENLDFTPLTQVLDYAAHAKPQVLILFGPFLDAGNQAVQTGQTKLPFEDEPCSFEDLYAGHILPQLLEGLEPLRRSKTPTEVLIVPSLEEALCFHPLPQPPLNAMIGGLVLSAALEKLRLLGVRFLPNPAHVVIDGLRLSLASADVLSPVLRELVLRPQGRKIDEALQLLLMQRTLFPVLPRDPTQVSEARAAALDFPDLQAPDLCIFPSQVGALTASFINETAFVNPGSLCRPAAPGTFVELWLPAGSGKISERLRVDVQKLD